MSKGKIVILNILLCIGGIFNNVLSQKNIIINEFMASNNMTIKDMEDDFPDWIEIKNNDSSTVSLKGWYLTDQEDNLLKWAFPDISLDKNEIIVVFASGKDRKLKRDSLHTNFQLSSSGEYLALVKPDESYFGTLFSPYYPEQYSDISYGFFEGDTIYFSNPSPGSENNLSTFISPPLFNIEHGHFFNDFELELSSETKDADIIYTTDASTPSISNGTVYTSPINITTTVVIRAIAVKPGNKSISVTQSYIFPNDVIRQPMKSNGYPDHWLAPVRDTDLHIEIDSDYGMHQNVVNKSDISPVIVDALIELPVVSIVSDIDNFFSESTHPDSGGIYNYTGASDGPTRSLKYHLGRDWVRQASIEYFDAKSDKIDFQANCAIKIHGGASRTPSKTAKHSFKIGFKSEFGPSKLKEKIFGKGTPKQFDWLILRSGFATRYGLQLKDPFVKSTYRDMGQYAANSKFVHLYINGLYWGMYNLSERMDENCMRDNFGGNDDDYDIVKDYYEVGNGDSLAWENLRRMLQDNISDKENYQKVLGNNLDETPNESYEKMLDPGSLIDYMLVNYYTGNTDWDHHNWVAVRRKTNSEGFKFLVWDAENTLKSSGENTTTTFNENRPTEFFNLLMENQEFGDLFISHVNKHFFDGGALTPEQGLKRYKDWMRIIDTAIVCESARWNSSDGSKSDIWETGYHTFIYDYFPLRTNIVLSQFIARGWYPSIEEPSFNTSDKYIAKDFDLRMLANEGEIVYSLDGSDPGHADKTIPASLYLYDGNPIPLNSDTITITARAKKDSLWSNVISKQFIVVEEEEVSIEHFADERNAYFKVYPNPFEKSVLIHYALTKPAVISLKIYNTMGELIATPDVGVKSAGQHIIEWNAENLSSGLYFGILENKTVSEKYKVTLIKK